MIIGQIKVQTVLMYACYTWTEINSEKHDFIHQNESNLLIFCHGDNSEFSGGGGWQENS